MNTRGTKRAIRHFFVVFSRKLGTATSRFLAAKYYRHLRSRVRRGQGLLLIYTMGKVGSSTLRRSLSKTAISDRVFHLHWLTKARLRQDEKFYIDAARRYSNTPLEQRFHPRYIWEGQYVATHLKKKSADSQKCRVITLVRDPVARDVSSFFQNLQLFFGFDYLDELKIHSEDEVVENLKTLFLKFYTCDTTRIEQDADPRTWFDEELKEVFGVDVYQTPFPKGKGYEIYHSQRADILLIRMEDLGSCAPAALENFMQLEDFSLASANISSNKDYSSIYKRFLKDLVLPQEYLDTMYGSKVAMHFYSDHELSEFRARWKQEVDKGRKVS